MDIDIGNRGLNLQGNGGEGTWYTRCNNRIIKQLLQHRMYSTALTLSPIHATLLVCVSGEAVFARCLSSLKEERVEASKSLSGPQGVTFSGDKTKFLEDIRKVAHAHH